MYYPDLEQVKSYRTEGNLVPVYREVIADLETPVSAFLKIYDGGYSFLLESVEGGQHLARYSFIGTHPYRVLSVDCEKGADPLPLIEKEMGKHRLVQVPGLPRFCGGAVGYLGYETVTHFERLPSPDGDTLELPEALFMFTDTLLVFDHITHTIKVVSLVNLDGDIEQNYKEAITKIDALTLRLKQPLNQATDPATEAPVSAPPRSNISRQDFMHCVDVIKEYIAAGEAIQVVPSQRFARPTAAPPFDIYRALRSLNPSPYMYFLDLNGFYIIGASPEILVRVEEDMVMTRPLAGTRPRGKDQAHDTALEKELRGDEKERAEHIMLVDLGRNDIGKVSEPGSVRVSDLMNVERYSHVMHLVTHVQGTLRAGLNAFDALRSCFPAGTVSGAPKIRAMEIIAELEPEKRGPYAGAVGYFSFSGNMDMAIAIRTMVLKDGVAYVQAGCGVVHDSVAESEFEETSNKALALLKAIDRAEAGKGRT